ncbi:MAG: surface protein, partial [Caulobacteraceae bacterium]|nr:surface protein [Caulobacteraceae bacterium]
MNAILPIRRRKRSNTLTLTTAMAATGLALTACDPAQDQAARQPVEAVAYADLNQCKIANEVPDAECDRAFAAAKVDDEKSAPRYEERASCEEAYGPGNCVPRGYNNGGGSFFTPLLTGFVIGRMLDGGGRPYYTGTGLYRDRGGGYLTGYGGRLD